jgi:hypothetical protein
MNNPLGEKMLFTASREALKKLMNLLIENRKKSVVRSINISAIEPKTSGVLRGHKQQKIDDNDIRVICDN